MLTVSVYRAHIGPSRIATARKHEACDMSVIPLVVITGVVVLGILGTVAKILFDDWRVRQMARVSALLSLVKPETTLDR
jgi:hypothetical protein